jgi:hypothetical protein
MRIDRATQSPGAADGTVSTQRASRQRVTTLTFRDLLPVLSVAIAT